MARNALDTELEWIYIYATFDCERHFIGYSQPDVWSCDEIVDRILLKTYKRRRFDVEQFKLSMVTPWRDEGVVDIRDGRHLDKMRVEYYCDGCGPFIEFILTRLPHSDEPYGPKPGELVEENETE